MLRLEYATVSLVRSCAGNTAGISKSNNSTNAHGLPLIRYLNNGIVYLRHLQRETKAVKNFLPTARQSTLPTLKLPNELTLTRRSLVLAITQKRACRGRRR